VQPLDHPDKGKIDTPGPFIHFSDSPAALRGAAPAIGQHTASILAEAGYSESDVEKLRADGAFG
ncbi:MAG: hypothetical protein ACREQY_00425, partial [Candidatus Binatia bacterium]